MAVCSRRVCEAHLLLAKVQVVEPSIASALDLVALLNYYFGPSTFFALPKMESLSIKTGTSCVHIPKEPDDSKSSGCNHEAAVVSALAR